MNSRYLYLAGKFACTDSEFFKPEGLSEEEFLGYYRSHVSKAKVPTPFISTSILPLAPVHRALHSPEGAMISVIITSKLETPVFKAHTLVSMTDTATWLWKGYGEFLIWGRIPTSAIACTFTIQSLMDIASTHQEIQQFLQLPLIESSRHCNGELHERLRTHISALGEYSGTLNRLVDLLGVPQIYQKIVAQKIEKAWTMKLPRNSGNRNKRTQQAPSSIKFGDPEQSMNAASEETDYQPSISTNDGSCDTSLEEAEDQPSDESSEAVCPRYDTPDDGQYSVRDESTACSEKRGQRVPITPPASGHRDRDRDRVLQWAQNTSVQVDTDQEDGWPSSDEGIIDTPTRPRMRIPPLHDKLARRAFFGQFEMGS